MPDRFGPRGVIALYIPLQNANMQPEYEAMRPEGVSNQIYRFTLEEADNVPDRIVSVVDGALGCWPDMVVIGNSVEMRVWTPEEHLEYKSRLQEKLGDVPVITATDACVAALKTIGAKKVAAISPMSDVYSKSVKDYYEAFGFEVVDHAGLQVAEPRDIIKIGIDEAREGLRKVDHEEVDTFLHVGGALGIVDKIEQLENDLGRPLISSNAATYWYALRKLGVTDPIPGFGQLLMKTDIIE